MTATDATGAFTPTRLVGGVELPIPGRWVVDPGHSCLAFETRHAAICRMRGRFRSFAGALTIAEDPLRSAVEVVIEAASIDTANAAADDALRGEHFLRVVDHPELHYRSVGVNHGGGSRWQVVGELTIRGVARPITLDAAFEGAVAMPGGRPPRLGFRAEGSFDRRDYGMELNVPMPGGEWLAGNVVRVELDVEAELR